MVGFSLALAVFYILPAVAGADEKAMEVKFETVQMEIGTRAWRRGSGPVIDHPARNSLLKLLYSNPFHRKFMVPVVLYIYHR